jgi:hypothetical protein
VGLETGQIRSLLVVESVLVVGMSLLAGTAIGYGLVRTILPYLSRALAVSLGGIEIGRAGVDWLAALWICAVLAICHLLAMGCSLLALVRARVPGAPRLSEE